VQRLCTVFQTHVLDALFSGHFLWTAIVRAPKVLLFTKLRRLSHLAAMVHRFVDASEKTGKRKANDIWWYKKDCKCSIYLVVSPCQPTKKIIGTFGNLTAETYRIYQTLFGSVKEITLKPHESHIFPCEGYGSS
jgi:hypothetical protein